MAAQQDTFVAQIDRDGRGRERAGRGEAGVGRSAGGQRGGGVQGGGQQRHAGQALKHIAAHR
ncbi:hypothetical protein D3C71_927950 [compost metagenome]